MRKHWETRELGEICTFFNGYTPKEEEIKSTGTIPYFKVSDMNHIANSKYLTHTALFLDGQCKVYPKWSIVFPKNGAAIATNKKRILGQNSIVDLNTGGVCADISLVHYEYLYLYFLSIDFRLHTRRGAVPTLDIAELKKRPIHLPSLKEQERIVAELDCLSDIIEKKKQQLKELDNLAQSIFYTTFGDPISNNFGWEIKPLGDVCESELGKTLDAKRNTGELYPYLCSINVQWGYFDLSVVKEMKMEPKELERYTVRKGDLLICEGGDTGRSAVWNRDEVIYYQNALHRLRFKANTMLPLFCQYLMLELKNKGEIAKYSKGQTIKHLVKSALLSIKAICPPFDLQQEFVSKIEAIEKQKDMIKQSIAETETLFNSRMDYYFN